MKALAFLLALLWAAPCFATPSLTNLGGQYAASPTTAYVITTTGTAANPSAIVVATFARTNPGTPSPVVDSAVNCVTYSSINTIILGSTRSAWFYCNPSAGLASGGTVTATYGTAPTSNGTVTAYAITGLLASGDPHDVVVTTNNASGNSFTLATGTLGQANELLLACVTVTAQASSDGYTEDAGNGWTGLTQIGSTNNRETHCAWQVVSATTTVNWSPHWTTAKDYAAQIVTFKAAAAGGVTVCTRGLMGVGC